MARKDEIKKNASLTIEKYKADEDYKYILVHLRDFTEKTIAKMCIPAVLGYVSGLEHAIECGDYVTMRRHEDSDRYMDSFRSAAERMRHAPAENVQMSLFDGSREVSCAEPDENESMEMTL
jgi:hypothetical protein